MTFSELYAYHDKSRSDVFASAMTTVWREKGKKFTTLIWEEDDKIFILDPVEFSEMKKLCSEEIQYKGSRRLDLDLALTNAYVLGQLFGVHFYED